MLTTTGLTRIFANRYDSIAGGVRDASFTLAAGDVVRITISGIGELVNTVAVV